MLNCPLWTDHSANDPRRASPAANDDNWASPTANVKDHDLVYLFKDMPKNVDYFSRFSWGRAYQEHTNVEVRDMWENHITLIFGWPRGVYSDNGSHFVDEPVQHMFQDHGVTHFTIL